MSKAVAGPSQLILQETRTWNGSVAAAQRLYNSVLQLSTIKVMGAASGESARLTMGAKCESVRDPLIEVHVEEIQVV